MADNVAVTPGTGASLAADEVGGNLHPRVKVSIGADGIAADQGTYKVSANFNRPANTTAYAVNDAVNDNTTAGSVTELSWSIPAGAGILRRVRVKKSDQTVATPTIRVWLYDTVFASAAGDNAAFSHPATDAIGYVDVDVLNAGTDDAVGWSNCDIPFVAGTLYGQLETLTAFTPANAETFTISLWYFAG